MSASDLALIDRVGDACGREIGLQQVSYPTGKIVVAVELRDCLKMVEALDPELKEPQICLDPQFSGLTDLDLLTGGWNPDRFALQLEDRLPLPEPVPCRGTQGMRPIKDPLLLEAIAFQITRARQIEKLLAGGKTREQ